MANSKGACTNCKFRFPREQLKAVPAGKFCSDKCLHEYANNHNNKARLVSLGRKEVKKTFAAKKRAFKLNDKKLRRNQAVTAFNKYIRLRDKNKPCISCQRYHTGQYHAGHYKPAGINSALKFNELNVHKQCSACNNNLSGNLTHYRINLIKKIGLHKVEELENNKAITSFTCDQLKAIEDEYKAKCKQLERDLAA
jgi:hypothetical protein